MIAHAKICFLHIVIYRAKIVVLVAKFLKKPEYTDMRRTYE